MITPHHGHQIDKSLVSRINIKIVLISILKKENDEQIVTENKKLLTKMVEIQRNSLFVPLTAKGISHLKQENYKFQEKIKYENEV